MRKSIRSTMCVAILLFGAPLIACESTPIESNNIIQQGDKNITSISIKEGTLPDGIAIGTFDNAGIKLVVSYSDNTSDEVDVNSTLIGQEYAQVLANIGTHKITLLYQGQEIEFLITIVPATYEVNFYARAGDYASYQLVDTQTVAFKEAASEPTIQHEIIFESIKYTFVEWDTDFTSITKNLDIYAIYSESSYTE